MVTKSGTEPATSKDDGASPSEADREERASRSASPLANRLKSVVARRKDPTSNTHKIPVTIANPVPISQPVPTTQEKPKTWTFLFAFACTILFPF
uniref:Uncharacterized protein n=1 Tax=Anopheles epiroticus TaxID=199890 RepID=A0A182PMB4_9DIPT